MTDRLAEPEPIEDRNLPAEAMEAITAYWAREGWTYNSDSGRAYDAVMALVGQDGMLTRLADAFDHQAFVAATMESTP